MQKHDCLSGANSSMHGALPSLVTPRLLRQRGAAGAREKRKDPYKGQKKKEKTELCRKKKKNEVASLLLEIFQLSIRKLSHRC